MTEEQLRKAAKSAVCKININSDSRLVMTAAVRKVFAEKPAEFRPRKYLGPARDDGGKLYKHKIVNILVLKTNWLNWTDKVNFDYKNEVVSKHLAQTSFIF